MTKAKRGLVEGGTLTVFLERHGEVEGQTAFSSRSHMSSSLELLKGPELQLGYQLNLKDAMQAPELR